jgi:hypothetical protein
MRPKESLTVGVLIVGCGKAAMVSDTLWRKMTWRMDEKVLWIHYIARFELVWECRIGHRRCELRILSSTHPEAIGKATAEWIKDADAIRLAR